MYDDDKRSEVLEDLEVSQETLDDLWEAQANLHFKYAEELVLIGKEIDDLKAKIDFEESTLDLKIRKDPKEYALEKTTDKAISVVVSLDKNIIKLKKQLSELQTEQNMFKHVLTSLEHKKKSLEKLSDLYINGYHSDPKISKEARKDSIDRTSKQVRKQMKEKGTLKNRRSK